MPVAGNAGQWPADAACAPVVDPGGSGRAGQEHLGGQREVLAAQDEPVRANGRPRTTGPGASQKPPAAGHGPGCPSRPMSWTSTSVRSARSACSSRSSSMMSTSAWSRVTRPTARSMAQPPAIQYGTARADSKERTASTGPKPASRGLFIGKLPPGDDGRTVPLGADAAALSDPAGERCNHEFIRHRAPPPSRCGLTDTITRGEPGDHPIHAGAGAGPRVAEPAITPTPPVNPTDE